MLNFSVLIIIVIIVGHILLLVCFLFFKTNLNLTLCSYFIIYNQLVFWLFNFLNSNHLCYNIIHLLYYNKILTYISSNVGGTKNVNEIFRLVQGGGIILRTCPTET